MNNTLKSTTLTPLEISRLAEVEAIIKENLTAFYKVGNALLEIRDGKLYRETHKTFEEYCRDKWDIDRKYAYRLMKSSEVIGNLSPIGDIPRTESQARPLSTLPPDKQRDAWGAVLEKKPVDKVTAKDVEDEVSKYKHTETHPVSDAHYLVSIAISQLERIRHDDPKRDEELDRLEEWIDQNR